nr:immunoglobulin light chain junction region [Macaca mulatta]
DYYCQSFDIDMSVIF